VIKESMKKDDLPKIIPVFPLSNFIIFPHTTVPLNIFEPRYVEMINDSMKTNKMIGLIQPKRNSVNSVPDLHVVGCLGKIANFKDISDGRYLINLKGISRFKITKEIRTNKPYRECEVNFDSFLTDLKLPKDELKFSDLELIFKNLKTLFEKKGYIINWKSLEKQDLNETINALAMASPFSLEEKQVLLESENLEIRKNKISEILSTYNYDHYDNTTIQ
jgi:Lon protease-like protein